jgi:hypothetical protein
MSPGHRYHAPRLSAAAKRRLNSPPESPKNWGQVNPHQNDYDSDSIEICSTFWLPDITDWWHQQEETRAMDADLSKVALDIFSIIAYSVGVDARSSLGQDVIV